jgi:type IV pilus assembly protein PilQ
LDNVPWDQALDLVLKTKALDKRQVGSVLMVAPANEIAEQERKQLEVKKQMEELAPLRTEHVQIIYADAKKVFEIFDGKASASGGEGERSKTILSPRGSAIIDERTNAIVLTETDEKIAEFRALMKQIDIPVRQVSIEARLVRASTDASKDLGVKWGVEAHVDLDGGPNHNVDTGSLIAGGPALFTSGTGVDLGAKDAASQLAIGIFDAANGSQLFMELSALQQSGKGEVISQPKVITQDKMEAIIKSGVQIPYVTETSSGGTVTTTTTFKDAVLQLKVTPYITTDDRIKLKVKINKDSRGEDTVAGPAIDTTEVTTEMMVSNGETAVVGGIYEVENVVTIRKVPFLGDLPCLGRLFRRNQESAEKVELLIFLTPRIMSDPLAKK